MTFTFPLILERPTNLKDAYAELRLITQRCIFNDHPNPKGQDHAGHACLTCFSVWRSSHGTGW